MGDGINLSQTKGFAMSEIFVVVDELDDEDGPIVHLNKIPEGGIVEKIFAPKDDVQEALSALVTFYDGHEDLALAVDAALFAAFRAGQRAGGA